MLRWAISFLVLALIAAVFGFGGIAAMSMDAARILFFVFIVLQIFWLLPYLPDDNADEPKKPAAEAATIVHDASSGGGKV